MRICKFHIMPEMPTMMCPKKRIEMEHFKSQGLPRMFREVLNLQLALLLLGYLIPVEYSNKL